MRAFCATAFSLALLFFPDGASDAFMQLYTRPGERWLMCSLLIGGDGDLQCIEEGVLGYGAVPPLNISQRLPGRSAAPSSAASRPARLPCSR